MAENFIECNNLCHSFFKKKSVISSGYPLGFTRQKRKKCKGVLENGTPVGVFRVRFMMGTKHIPTWFLAY